MGCFPAGSGPLRARGHEIRGEADHALVDEDDAERGQGVVQADLEAGVRGTQAAQHADRLDAALAPPHTAEPPVPFGLRIDQQEPGGPAGVVQALEQAPELGAHVRVRHPLGREYPGEAQPGDGLAHALQRLELGAAQFKLGRGGNADGLDQAVDPPLIVGSPAVLVDIEERVLVAAGDPADRITQFGRDAAAELLLDGRIGGGHRTVVRGK